MASIANLVHQVSTTTGSSNFTLSNFNGRQSFNSAFGTGAADQFYYFISNRDAAEWEVGTGHLSASTTLVRDTVINSSNSNAAVSFSAGTKDVTNAVPASSIRETLTSARTYYVRTDGSDSNTGLADTSAAAFLTPQKAVDTIETLEQNGNTVTISVRGSFNGDMSFSSAPTGPIVVTGTSGTPANDIIGNTASTGIGITAPINLTIQSVTVKGSYAEVLLNNGGATVAIGSGAVFAGSGNGLTLQAGYLSSGASFTVSGSKTAWLSVLGPAYVEMASNTITISGTPAWSTAGIVFRQGGAISLFSVTFSGSATGVRYAGSLYGTLNSYAAGTPSTYFPGNSNGTLSNAAQA